jgi:hypothetical protein
MIVEEVNAQFGIRTPIICTSAELMDVAWCSLKRLLW